MKSSAFALIASSFLAVGVPSPIAAQPVIDIFSSIPAPALTEKQKAMLDLARVSKATTAITMMAGAKASTLDALGKDGAARISLALTDKTTVTVTPTAIDVRSDATIWRGTVAETRGQVALVWRAAGQIAGTVQHEGHLYAIRPMGDDVHVIVEMSEDLMPPEHPPVMLLSSRDMHRNVTRPELRKRAATDAPVAIDVLVAYTSKAARYYSDIRQELIELAIEEANNSFRMSNLGHIKLRLAHAHATEYAEAGGHFDHLWRLADKGDGHMEEVHGLRDKHRADVVVLVVDDAQGCGLSTRVHADADEAFAVVHHECAATTHSLAHEIGHIIGARHDLSMDKMMTPFPYGHGYVNGTKWRDIMSYRESCGGCPRVPVWSSPTVQVRGEPAGSADQDNARVIAEQASRVASFR